MNATRIPQRRDTRIPNARRLRRNMTAAERKLWQQLKQISIVGTHFRRQAIIGPYYADFACHEHRFVVEVDAVSMELNRMSRRTQNEPPI
jgi:very-short-patch-repair endonuclease